MVQAMTATFKSAKLFVAYLRGYLSMTDATMKKLGIISYVKGAIPNIICNTLRS